MANKSKQGQIIKRSQEATYCGNLITMYLCILHNINKGTI